MTSDERIPLIGRDVERSELDALLEEVRTGSSRAVVIEGEPGIGETRLVDDAVDLASQKGFLIRRAIGEELLRDLPFGLVRDALRIEDEPPDPDRRLIAETLGGRFPKVELWGR